jgi:hypothetical protein
MGHELLARGDEHRSFGVPDEADPAGDFAVFDHLVGADAEPLYVPRAIRIVEVGPADARTLLRSPMLL